MAWLGMDFGLELRLVNKSINNEATILKSNFLFNSSVWKVEKEGILPTFAVYEYIN